MSKQLTKLGLSDAGLKRIAQMSPYETGQQAEWEKHLFNEVKGGLGKFAESLSTLISDTLSSVSDEKHEEMYDALDDFLTNFYMSSDYGPD